MTHAFVSMLLVFYSAFAVAARWELPAVNNPWDVQGRLKKILDEELRLGGPLTWDLWPGAKLRGTRERVVLKDQNARLECNESSAEEMTGMLPTTRYTCVLTTPGEQKTKSLELPMTEDARSVQASLKGLLWDWLEAHGSQKVAYESKLWGSHGEVVIEDRSSKIVCRESPPDEGRAPRFGCEFTIKDTFSLRELASD